MASRTRRAVHAVELPDGHAGHDRRVVDVRDHLRARRHGERQRQNGLNGGIIAAAYAQGAWRSRTAAGPEQPVRGTSILLDPGLTISLSGNEHGRPGDRALHGLRDQLRLAAYSAATFTDSLAVS